jgi:hypothetical protein
MENKMPNYKEAIKKIENMNKTNIIDWGLFDIHDECTDEINNANKYLTNQLINQIKELDDFEKEYDEKLTKKQCISMTGEYMLEAFRDYEQFGALEYNTTSTLNKIIADIF